MSADIELMNLFWSSAGIFPGEGEISRFDFKDRVESAARAGFKGIGIWHTDLEHCTLHRSLREMKSILDDNGIKYVELEFLTDWFLDGARKIDSDNRKRRLLEASAALGAKHIKVGDFYNTPCPMPRIVESFAALCADAANYGATIGFEFMASAMLHSLDDVLAMVEAAGAKNGGIVVDLAHVMALRISNEELARIPLRRLVNVELNDGALPGSPKYDPARERRFCGEGDFDIRGFIGCMQGIGYRGPWAVEVISKELVGLGLDELNARSFASTMAAFAATASDAA
jgi:sugar phosphate isomerase/epimerase